MIHLTAAAAVGCAGTPWPDEAGVPVPTYQVANVDAEDAFLIALSTARATNGVSAPLVTPRYQPDIRTFASDLQSGKVSVAGALRAIGAWGRAAYGRSVDTWAIDCGGPGPPALPPRLQTMPSAVISYAAAHFQPKSLPHEQCAVLVVSVAGSGDESVTLPPSGQ